MAGKIADLILIYQFIKRLTTPFEKTEAFKLGLIDKSGKRTKEPLDTKEKENAYGYFDRLVINVKRLLEKLPGGKSQLASYGAALFLIKEAHKGKEYTEQQLLEELEISMSAIDENTLKTFNQLLEEVPANATGAAVAGTGDDPVHWKKIDGRKKETKSYIKAYLQRREKREELKKKEEMRKLMGL
mgnify:CR=1 FL=1